MGRRLTIRFELCESDSPLLYASLFALDTGERRRARLLSLATVGATLEAIAGGHVPVRRTGADPTEEPNGVRPAAQSWAPPDQDIAKIFGIELGLKRSLG